MSPQHRRTALWLIYRLACSAVGVFVNENLDTVTHIARTSGVHMVQLHGDRKP